MMTLQIAWAKEHFLERALHLITPVSERDERQVRSLVKDAEDLVRDAVSLFDTLLRCDEQHHSLAATVETYPYQATEEELTVLFRRFLAMCEALCALSQTLQVQGFEIESSATLDKTCTHARRLVHDDQAFHATETYQALAERGYKEAYAMSATKYNAIPVIKLQEAQITLGDLLTQYQGQAVGFQVPHLDSVLLLLPNEEYRFVASVFAARSGLPTRPPKTPTEYFAEIVRTLRQLEQKYGMSSAEFYRQFQEGILQEGPDDYWEWRMRYKGFWTMKERFGFSETEVSNA